MTAGGSVLVASDLDGTLIYSRRRLDIGNESVQLCGVETLDGVTSSYMTQAAASGLSRLIGRYDFVPATARTAEQYRRLRLPATSRYAVVANGATILVQGLQDPGWARQVALNLRHGLDLKAVLAHARNACRSEWTTAIRVVEDAFCYACVIGHLVPQGWLAQQQAWAADRGWRTSLQGHKFYWVPAALTKSAAVAEIAARCGSAHVIAAGDAVLDSDLLEFADLGVHPSHGELAAIGWSSASVTRLAESGVRAGEAIVDWFAATAAALSDGDGDGDGALAAQPAAPRRPGQGASRERLPAQPQM
ncbi:MAG: HAD family hydrolase [Actinomycetota bacterium]|nr:HAD family hydrolase [Actinomycetota bacterium]